MTDETILKFVKYATSLSGDEKGEAQVFLDRFFQAFGHLGYKEAGASLEHRVYRKDKHTAFADLVWESRLLLEMKKRGENLHRHYDQIRDYWYDAYPKPRYAVLCNFDEFWIYDFFTQGEPVDKVLVTDLPRRYTVFNFMFPEEKRPLFQNDREFVSRSAANKVANVFNSLVKRGEDRKISQRFMLQCVFSLFAEDFGLLPRALFTELIRECKEGSSSYDLFDGLFRQMNSQKEARGGRFRGVDYFNGGLFKEIDPIDLGGDEITLLAEAADEDWSKVQPHIFGALFEGSMDREGRHALGAHFTCEADINKIIRPTIEIPWKEKIQNSNTLKELGDIRRKITEFKVLDPACGCGNFLYVAFMQLRRLEMLLLQKIHDNFSPRARAKIGMGSRVSLKQFHGIDLNPFAVELAKVTLVLAKEQSIKEAEQSLSEGHHNMEFDFDAPLPLDNLDEYIRCDDALFCEWPQVDTIIGNPPYQSKNKMVQEFGEAYVQKVRRKYSGVPGRADYCVHWFRRAHDELRRGDRAGLVGTNTIRQNYSRQGGLDYILENGGTIVEAVSSQPWSGDAVVHVSIVNWLKGEHAGPKVLITDEVGTGGLTVLNKCELDFISAALSARTDVTTARPLRTNETSGACYQGKTHGHRGFLLAHEDAKKMRRDARCQKVIHPYLIGNDLLGNINGLPSRCAIDLNHCESLLDAKSYGTAYLHLEQNVLPDIMGKAEGEREKTRKETGPRQNHLQKWWKYWRGRPNMTEAISRIDRYIACARVTKRPIFEFISTGIHPNDALQVFPLEDDYSFGILQSGIHWQWFVARCSTLKDDFRYTSNTVFDSFPWPQSPDISHVKNIAEASVKLRGFRWKIMREKRWTLRELYRTLETPGTNPLRHLHATLDNAVMNAYGMNKKDDVLDFLLSLNLELADVESRGDMILGPGLHICVKKPAEFITKDCVSMSVIDK